MSELRKRTNSSTSFSKIVLDEPTAPPQLLQFEHPTGVTYLLIRFPLMIVILWILVAELLCYAFLRVIVAVYEVLRNLASLRREKQLEHAEDYKHWALIAKALDKEMGREQWKLDSRSTYYDHELIRMMSKELKKARKVGDVGKIMRLLVDSGMRFNLGGIYNQRLYAHTFYGTKKAIEQFVHEGLSMVFEDVGLGEEDKRRFFKQCTKMYGRTALCLSGGGAFGFYHVGVLKALIDEGCLPTIISGTSAGSGIAAFICCHTDEEIKGYFNDVTALREKLTPYKDSVWGLVKRLYTKGTLFDTEDALRRLANMSNGHITFLEAYHRTGRILNITVASEDSRKPSHVLNYITTPHVIICSAILASSALPFMLHPIPLISKEEGVEKPIFYRGLGSKWRDGSFRMDIPTEKLTQIFNCQYTVVSQVNPLVIPFFYERYGSGGQPSSHNKGLGFKGGFICSFLELLIKLDMKKWLYVLRHLFILPHYLHIDMSYFYLQQFSGNITVYPKPTFIDYIYAIRPPSTDKHMEYYIEKGQRIIWPKIYMLKQRLRIEKIIDSFLMKK